MGRPRQSAWTQLPSPTASPKPQIWANSRCLPRVQRVPPQPGQQALTVRFLAASRVSGGLGPPNRRQGEDVSIQPSPIPVPENGLGWSIWSFILSDFLM